MKILFITLLMFWSVATATAAAAAPGFENNLYGVEALKAKKYDEAVSYLAAASREAPGNEVIKNNLVTACNAAALAYDRKGEYYKARDLMEKACLLAPDSPRIKKNFAILLVNEGFRRYNRKKNEDVIGPLKESFAYDDSLAQARALLGQAYYERDDYINAKEHWEKALSLDPALADFRKKLDKLNKELASDNALREQYHYQFKVRYDRDVAWRASREVLDMLQDAYLEAGRKLTLYPQEPLTVIIYTQEQFQSVSGMPDWFAGAYDGKIRLRQSDVEGDKQRLRQIIYHEYMHALVHYVAGNSVPVWLNEGIAQCYENMPAKAALDPAEKNLLKEKLAEGIPGLDRVEQAFAARGSETDVRLAYLYSKAFAAYIIDKGWDSSLKNLLEELKAGVSVDNAFSKIYFRQPAQMRDDWLWDLKYNSAD
ncbi:MAG: tetratricopeptide repeat protein [Endomicrobiales bacterium]